MLIFSPLFRNFLDRLQMPFDMSRDKHESTGRPNYCHYCHFCQRGEKCRAIRQNGEGKIKFGSSVSPGTGDKKMNYAGGYSHLVANPKSLMNALVG
jgi:hypothetical protein